MKRIIIDASAALALYLKDEGGEYAINLLQSFEKSKIIIPQHWWVEVASGLLMAERRKRISSAERDEAMQQLMCLEPEVITITPLDFAKKVIPIAHKYNLTSYDACYLYLAIREGVILATLDKALKLAAKKSSVLIFDQ